MPGTQKKIQKDQKFEKNSKKFRFLGTPLRGEKSGVLGEVGTAWPEVTRGIAPQARPT